MPRIDIEKPSRFDRDGGFDRPNDSAGLQLPRRKAERCRSPFAYTVPGFLSIRQGDCPAVTRPPRTVTTLLHPRNHLDQAAFFRRPFAGVAGGVGSGVLRRWAPNPLFLASSDR